MQPGHGQRIGRAASFVAIGAAVLVVILGRLGVEAMGLPMIGLLTLLPALAILLVGLLAAVIGLALGRDRFAGMALLALLVSGGMIGTYAGLAVRSAWSEHATFREELRAELDSREAGQPGHTGANRATPPRRSR